MESRSNPNIPKHLTLVGYTLKPFGLLGELKIKPATFDLSRHSLIKIVFFKKVDRAPSVRLQVTASREHQNFWYFKFNNYNTPESLKLFSSGLLFVSQKERLRLPEGSIYHSDIIGFECRDSAGKILGTIKDVRENPAHNLLVLELKGQDSTRREMLVPWVDAYVKKLDLKNHVLETDISRLEGLDGN